MLKNDSRFKSSEDVLSAMDGGGQAEGSCNLPKQSFVIGGKEKNA